MKRLILILMLTTVATSTVMAQHTFGVMGGYGSGSDSIYPDVESRSVYGLSNFGVSWRTYSEERVVGCFGLDLQYIERGFSYSPYASTALEGEELFYYTRRIKSIMLPIVWQPHFYIAERRIRVFFEAAATFNYDFSSTYNNDYQRNLESEYNLSDRTYDGDYEYMVARDNKFGYGLAGGGGAALLLGKFEILGRIRYYIGMSDVVRNRTKYYSNNLDGTENPFGLTPIRSSLNNLMISFGVNYHFGPAGFDSWEVKRVKGIKLGDGFKYKETK